MNYVKIKDLMETYGKGKTWWNTILCRPEFNKFDTNYGFKDVPEFHAAVQHIKRLKETANGRRCQHCY